MPTNEILEDRYRKSCPLFEFNTTIGKENGVNDIKIIYCATNVDDPFLKSNVPIPPLLS